MTHTEKLAEIREKVKGCTEGEWEASKWRVCANVNGPRRITVVCDTATNQQSRTIENEANAQLIAAAPTLITIAIDLHAENERLREGLIKVIAHCAHLPGAEHQLLVELLANCDRIARAALTGRAKG